jgi:hypothetical protein
MPASEPLRFGDALAEFPLMHACTIVARNYFAHAQVLAESFLERHPDAGFTILVLDGDVGADAEAGFELSDPYSIGIPQDEVHRMAAMYGVTEFATAVKPWLLRTLLARHDAVMYLDPDIDVLTPLDDIFALAQEHAIVLTPHTLKPLPRDGAEPNETTILRAGVYNLGFIAVGTRSSDFLDWWSERLARECIIDPAFGRFVDQRWVDFVPALFRHHILLDPGANVAWWNLTGRRIGRSDSGWTVDDAPIRFFHFSGFSPGAPDLLSKYLLPVPRIQLPALPELAALVGSYSRRLVEHDYDRYSGMPYSWDTTAAGQAIGPRLRSAYRRALLHAEALGGSAPPDPFDPAQAPDFGRWSADLPPEALQPPLDRVADLLSHGAGGFFLGRGGGATTMGRRLTRRLIWPFLSREYELHRAYLELLADQERRIGGVESDVAARSNETRG